MGNAMAAGPPHRRRRAGASAEPPHRDPPHGDRCERRAYLRREPGRPPRRAPGCPGGSLMLRLPSFTYLAASTVEEAVGRLAEAGPEGMRSEEHTSELQSLAYLVCRLLLEKKKKT